MSISLKGRTVLSGMTVGEACVTNKNLDFKCDVKKLKNKNLVVRDKSSELFQKNLIGKIICVPNICDQEELLVLSLLKDITSSICFLCSEELSQSIMSQFIILKRLFGVDLIVIDKLGNKIITEIDDNTVISVCDGLVVTE